MSCAETALSAMPWPTQISIAQVPDTLQQAASILTGPQIFAVLLTGLLMAFAFQLLLTSLGIAAGITVLGFQLSDRSPQNQESTEGQDSTSLGSKIGKIGFAAGLGILFTINTVLFAACFLAVKLSLVQDPILGAALGVVIWSAYFLILTWVSSTAVTSLVGSLFSSAASGFRSIVSTVSTVLNSQAPESERVLTESGVRDAVRQEVQAALGEVDIQATVEDYLKTIQPPKPDLEAIRQELEQRLKDPELKSLAESGELNQVNRQTFVDLIGDRTDFSKQDIDQVADQLESVWQRNFPQQAAQTVTAKLSNFIQSAAPEEFKSNPLKTKLKELMGEGSILGIETATLLQPLRQLDFKTVMHTLLKRVDLSELDVEKVWSQLQALRHDSSQDEAIHPSSVRFSTIRADVEDYLLNAYPWQLDHKTVKAEFRDLLYDPEADPQQVRQQLEQLRQEDFGELLNQRDDLKPARVEVLAGRLEEVRLEVLETVQAAESKSHANHLQSQLAHYFRSLDPTNLKSKNLQRTLKEFLASSQTTLEHLDKVLSEFDRAAFEKLLEDSKPGQKQIEQMEAVRDRLLAEIQALQTHAQSEADDLWQKLESYLRYTNIKKLSPETVQHKLETLLEDSQVGLADLRSHLPEFNRAALISLLKRRQGLATDQIEQIVTPIEETWHQTVQLPGQVAQSVGDQSDHFTAALVNYLQKLDGSNLNLEEMRQDLTRLTPVVGTWALRQLSQVDWESVRGRLQHQPSLSEEQVEQMLDRVRELAHQLAKAPRRRATRMQESLQDFSSTLQDYLQHSEKADFNPEGIQYALQLLLKSGVMPSEPIASEAGQLLRDRPTLTAFLLEREDITEAESQQILDQLESSWNHLLEQSQQMQHQIQTTLEQLLNSLHRYFSDLKLPDFNSDSVEQMLQKLLDLPHAGFVALSDSLESALENSPLEKLSSFPFETLQNRLSQFNQTTLVTLLKARDDLPEAVQSRLLDQVEGTRDRLLHQVQSLQQEAQRRVEDLKQQAQRRTEETRKAAAIAAWLLFWTAFTSVSTSAIAGTVAVTGIPLADWITYIRTVILK